MNEACARQRTREGLIFLVLFALTIPAANWLIGHVGTACLAPRGPCLVPVAPGIMAPSGVTMVGIALVLRDLVQRRLGTAVSALAIVFGAALSALVAPPAVAVHPLGRVSDSAAFVTANSPALVRLVVTDTVWPGVTMAGAWREKEQQPKPTAKMCMAVDPCTAALTSGRVTYFTVLSVCSATEAK